MVPKILPYTAWAAACGVSNKIKVKEQTSRRERTSFLAIASPQRNNLVRTANTYRGAIRRHQRRPHVSFGTKLLSRNLLAEREPAIFPSRSARRRAQLAGLQSRGFLEFLVGAILIALALQRQS